MISKSIWIQLSAPQSKKGAWSPQQYLNHDEAGFFFTHTQKHAGFLWCEKVYTNKAVTNSVYQVLASITEGSTA